jgi:hypothetical protein
MNAHVAPGLTWGAAWWFLARGAGGEPTRRYASGWILLALAAGFAIAGERGWMQWPHFFSGQLATNYGKGEYVSIARGYGFLWFFIAGAAWAGLPACLLAWCGTGRPTHAWEWTLRIACGFAGGYLAWRIFTGHPNVFLPLYDSIQDKYQDFRANPNLAKLYRDNGSSLRHIGFCLGFLAFEIGRKDWQNVKLILTVGLMTGLGWAACQIWRWAAEVWPGAAFNFGRCWEASGGGFIGLGFGLAYYLVNRRTYLEGPEKSPRVQTWGIQSREWVVASVLLLLVGGTMFWPAPRDMRQPTDLPVNGPSYLLGAIYLMGGIGCGGLALYRLYLGRRPSRQDADGRWAFLANNERLGELALILVLSWFIKTQMASEYGDGVADRALSGWFGPGSIYFAVALAYVAARLLRLYARPAAKQVQASQVNASDDDALAHGFDWLPVYLGLSVITLWCLSVGLVNGWHAPIWFGALVATFGIGYQWLAHGLAPTKGGFCRFWPPQLEDPTVERWGIFLGLVYGLGLSLRKALKGGAHLYVGKEDAWDQIFWNWVSFGMLASLAVGTVWILTRAKQGVVRRNESRHTYAIVWLVLIAQNVLAQVVTGPLVGPRASWSEFAFSILYAVLFFLTAAIIFHYHWYFRCVPKGRARANP